MRRLAAATALAALAAGFAASSPSAAAPKPCAGISAAEPQAGHNMPPPAPGYFPDATTAPAYPHFAPDFPVIYDCEWGYPIGGFGGIRRHAPLRHVPIVFVHGNQADAENWFLVRDQLLQQGWTDQEMYALSYNGLANWYAGAPTQSQPDASTQAYLTGNSKALYNGGNGAADDVNVPDVYAFVRAVMDYTGSPYIDFVSHSLGVTIVRKMMYDHRDLYRHVLAGVMIAGANHGTSVCYELQATYYGCDEIAPDDSATGYVNPWLQQLNSIGEAPGPTCWQTIYDGSGGDPFFDPPYTQSPALKGADNHGEFSGAYHNDLRVSPATVAVYSQFLQQHGQTGSFQPCGEAPAKAAPGEAGGAAAEAERAAALADYVGVNAIPSAGLPAVTNTAADRAVPAGGPAPQASEHIAGRLTSRPSAPPVVPLAVALLVLAAAGAGAWYARRRWATSAAGIPPA